jgi:hypothetical protein
MTPSEYAASFGTTPIAKQIEELTSLYNLIRFGDEPIQSFELRRARQLLSEIRASLRLISGGICLKNQ